MNTDSLVIQIKGFNFYEDIAGNFETRYDTSNYKDKRRSCPLLVGKKNN